MEGTVKWYNTKKGYGFIVDEDNNEFFVHYTSLPENTSLNEGDKVTFEPHETPKGKQAKNIVVLEVASQ